MQTTTFKVEACIKLEINEIVFKFTMSMELIKKHVSPAALVSINFSCSKKKDKLPPNNQSKSEYSRKVYCLCQEANFVQMVLCGNFNCKYEWFHLTCIGIKEILKRKWDCSPRLNTKRDCKCKIYL